MEFFDSHAHYDDEKFDEDREQIINLIYEDNITKFISAGYDLKSSKMGLELANKYEFIYTTAGISPNDVKNTMEETKSEIEELESFVKKEKESAQEEKRKSKIVGIGEIGLDYYWNQDNKEIQKYAFKKQIEIANKYNLPIVIHSREAIMDTIDTIKDNPVSKKGVFHCCPFNRELVKEALKLGFYISFAGPTTFKNSKNAEEIVGMVPEDKILIETDSPYLSPEPLRGRRNDSRNVKLIAQKISKIKNKSIEEIAKLTYQNALRIFEI